MSDLHWTSQISSIQPNEIRLRGYRVDQLMGQVSFGQAVYLALRGELPSPEIGRLMDAILISSLDHGATPPSTLAARTAASTGASLSASVAAGLLCINSHHGGAIEGAMRLLLSAIERTGDCTLDDVAAEVLGELRAKKRHAAGLGHRIHTDDPRSKRLLAMADEFGVSGAGVAMARALERATTATLGKHLPLNVDGALAALLVDLGFPPEVGNALFLIARVTGLAAHAFEEMTCQRPMRQIHPTDHGYDGPAARELE